MSNTKLIDKCVPQRFILGPLLFTICINDFPSCLFNAFCNIFADDTMIGVSDKSITKILGPLLFTICINDFPSCLFNAFCNIFADDTMIGVSDKSITKIQQLLQNAVNEAINGLDKIS